MSEDVYQPIACDSYDIYEIAIMQRQLLRLEWREADGSEVSAVITPKALKVENKAEFLIGEHNGETLKIRLDKVIKSTIKSAD